MSEQLNRLFKRKQDIMIGEGVETNKPKQNLIVSPLSDSTDPRVKKLKKELERLDLKPPKPKYIQFKV